MRPAQRLIRRLREPPPDNLDRTLAWSTFQLNAWGKRGARGTGSFPDTLRDAVRMFDDLGVRYVLIGATALGIYNYVRATEDLDFLVSEEDRARLMANASQYGFRPIEVRDVDGTFRPSRLTLRHGETGITIQFVTHRTEALSLALDEGETVDSTAYGIPVVGPTLGLAILTKLLRGGPQDEHDIWRLVLKNPALLTDPAAQESILAVLRMHSGGDQLAQRFLALVEEARRQRDADPDRYGEEE